jgi:hypothetical protein
LLERVGGKRNTEEKAVKGCQGRVCEVGGKGKAGRVSARISNLLHH